MSSKSGFREGTGYTLHQADDGFYLDIDRDSPLRPNYPFRVKIKKVGTVYSATVKPGTVNNLVPKIAGTYLDADTAPTLTLNTGKNIIALKVTYTTATFFPSTVEVVNLSSDEALTPTDTNGFLQIASVNISTVDGSTKAVANQFIFSSQVALRAKGGTGTAVWAFNSR